MQTINKMILWLAFILACFVPASAQTQTAPENCIWEISSIGYDAPIAEATDLANRTETPTSNYDTAPIHRAAIEEIPTEANRTLFGPNAEFKAAEGAGAMRRVVIGENMAGRVQPFADNIGAETYQPGAYKNFVDSRQQQQAWIKSMADQGRPIIDIGPDLARSNFSPYYDLETTTLQDMNYPTINALQPSSGVPVR